MAFRKPSDPPIPIDILWCDEYPAEQVPAGLRHEEVRPGRSVDGKLSVACRIYRWPIVVACWNRTSNEWEQRTATAFSHRRVDTDGEVHSGVSGPWNQALDRKLWRRWGPFMWCMLAMPEAPTSASERKADRAPSVATEPHGG